MATINERLVEPLKVLRNYQEKNIFSVICGQEALGVTHTRRLLDNRYLPSIIRGCYMTSFPGSEGDTTVWYTSYWQFVAVYSNYRFGKEWCHTAEQFLDFYRGYYVVPKQVVIKAKRANNNVIQLMFADTLLDLSTTLLRSIVKETRFGLNIYSLAEALLSCTPQYFISNRIGTQTCLESLNDASEIISLASDQGNSTKALRIVGALNAIDRTPFANEIFHIMKRLGDDLKPENPFETGKVFEQRIILRSSYCIRIQLMWGKMRQQILKIDMFKTNAVDFESVIKNMDASYVKDSYHSLSIKGYRVTDGLIERVRSGNWNFKDVEKDNDARNALTARGYYQAFQSVHASVEKNGLASDIVSEQLQKWYLELFEPCVHVAIIQASDMIGYRKHQVYIRGSKHTPVNPNAVLDAMQTFHALLRHEENALVCAIFGYFFVIYIHPYMNGNGRTARFVMNSLLVTGGYSWTIISVEKRDEYMAVLERASIDSDITIFAKFIFDLLVLYRLHNSSFYN